VTRTSASVDRAERVSKPRRSGHTIYIRDDAMEYLQYAAKRAGVAPGRLIEDLIKCLAVVEFKCL